MNKEQKLVQFITGLIKDTINEKIVWKRIDIPNSLSIGTDNFFPLCFKANYNETNFILFEKRYKHFIDENEYHWTYEIKIGILDKNTVTWENSEFISNLNDFFIYAKEKSSGIDSFLKAIK